MAPPPLRQFASTSAMTSSQVTEDTPPDLLEGTMDLTVILPTGHRVNMEVHRSTPMMDLLIQVTTAHKVSPGGHVIHVVSDNRLLSYKPSTPIGTLDTSIIQIVAKNRMNEEAKKRRAHLVTQAIEKNVRLKVNLPKNQLAVYRVPPKTVISDVLAMVCKDRCLELENHEIRHPVNVDEKLRGSCTLADYQLQEVSVVPKDFRAPPLSVTDLITMAAISSSGHPEDKKRRGILSLFSRKTKSSAGESSLSSGSAGERSVSPARSDESTDGHPTPRPLSLASSSATLTNDTHARGQPPPLSRPPSSLNLASKSRKRQAPTPPTHPTRQGSHNDEDSNGRSSETVEPRTKAQSTEESRFAEYEEDRSPYVSPAGSEISSAEATRLLLPHSHQTNLTSVSSTSNLSLVSRNKRRAPPPPKPPQTRSEELPSAIPEEEAEPPPQVVPPPPAEEEEVEEDDERIQERSKRSPSPASSHVSSVSSLSSVEHQAASTPNKPSEPLPLPPTPPKEEASPSTDPPPPPSDHEVQTRTESFGSESSEGFTNPSSAEKPVITPQRSEKDEASPPSVRSRTSSSSSESTESSSDSDNVKEDGEVVKKEQANVSSGSSDGASSCESSNDGYGNDKKAQDRSSSDSSDDDSEVENKKESKDDKKAALRVLEEVLHREQKHEQSLRDSSYESDLARRGTGGGAQTKPARSDSSSSDSSEDSEGDVRTVGEEVERDLRITANSPLSSVRIPIANEISNKSRDEKLASLANEKQHHVHLTTKQKPRSSSTSSCASSVSAVSSTATTTSSSSSSLKDQKQQEAQVSQQMSKKKIETSLETAFAKVNEDNTRIILDLPSPGLQESSDWEYKIPDPPTPFKDPSTPFKDPSTSRAREEESSESSEALPEVLSDVPSGFKDSPSGSISEAKNTEIIDKIESDMETAAGEDTVDSSSYSSSHVSDERAKQNVIDELKSVVGESNVGSEPRIVELKPKTRHVEMVMSPSNDDAVEIKEEVLPTRLNFPIEHSFVPRVVAKQQTKNEELTRKAKNEELNRKAVTANWMKESTSSYESAFGSDSRDEVDDSGRSRSGSSTSYESAPPPVPEIPPPPSDSESSNVSRAPVMSFSISTYKSRAEETSYDKKLGKSESFNHQTRPRRGNINKTDSFSAYRDIPEPPSFVDELLEEKDRPPPIPEKTSFSSKMLGLREKSRSQQHIPTFERTVPSSGKPAVPPNKPSLQAFGREGHLAYPEPTRPPRRLQRADSQERLARATSLSNLSTQNFDLRKAQSTSELSYGSGPSNTPVGNAEMPGFPGMMGMPSMMMPGGGAATAAAMMPNDSRLAEEFVKLQQDFFKWQQQLLQNQHVLHSRVAPLASNPPQLQSVGVMRDIMSQEAPAAARSGPVERIIPIKMEMSTSSTTTSTSSGGNNFGGGDFLLRPNIGGTGRLSQSMQDVSLSDPVQQQQQQQQGVNNRVTSSQQMPTQRRWGNEPTVSVGAWNERPSQPVGVYRDQDYATSSSRSRSTQDLSSTGPPSAGVGGGGGGGVSVGPQNQTFNAQPEQSHFVQSQQTAPPPQQFQSLPPQQQQQFAQFLQQQQQRQEPDRATFWRNFDTKGEKANVNREPEPARNQYRNSTLSYHETTPPQDDTSKPLTYFGQEVQVQEPPQTYYYNGDRGTASGAATKPSAGGGEATTNPRYTSVVTLSSDKEGQPGGTPGDAPSKDKVKSVVQLNNDQQQRNAQKTVAPVVRGFRQPGEEKPGALPGSSFHSKIINNANKSQQQPLQSSSNVTLSSGRGISPPHIVPVPEAPTAARLVAAVSQPAPSTGPTTATPSLVQSSSRVSPPKTGQSRTSPSRSSPSPSRSSPSSGPAFAGVQLRPVPAAPQRASPPSEVVAAAPPPPPPPAPVPPPPPPSAGAVPPPPPPPAPPMAPPPPPPASAGTGERRTASGKRIVSSKTGPELDTREELMIAIRKHGGLGGLRKTGNFAFSQGGGGAGGES